MVVTSQERSAALNVLTQRIEDPAHDHEKQPIIEKSSNVEDFNIRFNLAVDKRRVDGILRLAPMLQEVLVLEPLLQKIDEWFPITNNDYPITENDINSLSFEDEPSRLALVRRYNRAQSDLNNVQKAAHADDSLQPETLADRLNPKRLNITNNGFGVANSAIGILVFDYRNPIRQVAEDAIGAIELAKLKLEFCDFAGPTPTTNPILDFSHRLLDADFPNLSQDFFQLRALLAVKKAEGARFANLKRTAQAQGNDFNDPFPPSLAVTNDEVSAQFAYFHVANDILRLYQNTNGDVGLVDSKTLQEITSRLRAVPHIPIDAALQAHLIEEELKLFMGQKAFDQWQKIVVQQQAIAK